MKSSVVASQRLDPGRLPGLLLGGLAIALIALAHGPRAQNNDNGGILPGKTDGKSGVANALDSDSMLAVTGQLDPDGIVEGMAALHLSGPGFVAVTPAFGVSAEEAEFTSDGSVATLELASGELRLQGTGTLNPEIGLGLRVEASHAATGRAALLLGHAPDVALDGILAGTAAPFAIVPMGDVPSLDLVTFHNKLVQQGATGALFRVTIVFVSVDGWGLTHVAAVSGLTGGGGALELAFQ